jgi:hypothetical protein
VEFLLFFCSPAGSLKKDDVENISLHFYRGGVYNVIFDLFRPSLIHLVQGLKFS